MPEEVAVEIEAVTEEIRDEFQRSALRKEVEETQKRVAPRRSWKS